MAFLASFLRTLTLAFAALHFLDPAPLGRGPRAPRVDARQCATRAKERAARAALWGRAKANGYAPRAAPRFVHGGARGESRMLGRGAGPDAGRALLRVPGTRPAPTAEEKRSLREARRQANVTRKLPRAARDDLIRKTRDDGTWRKFARGCSSRPII